MAWNEDRVAGTLRISQPAYIAAMRDDLGMTTCQPSRTPAEPNTKLHLVTESDPRVKDFNMASSVGAAL